MCCSLPAKSFRYSSILVKLVRSHRPSGRDPEKAFSCRDSSCRTFRFEMLSGSVPTQSRNHK
jgi:hypothetical protein